jgi:lysosomal Pro-X carboxypeptidase
MKQEDLFSSTQVCEFLALRIYLLGNEGNIEAFWDNSGFVMEAATTFKALVVFAEHRYYGKSWPFGLFSSLSMKSDWQGSESKSLERANIVFLSVEQALGDALR